MSKLASYVSRLSLILLIATGEIIAVPLLQSSAALPGVSAALADDDDGDDGDDDDDDGGGSASGGRSSGGDDDDDDGPRGDLRSLFRWPFQREERRAERRPQRRTVSIPDRAPNEIVAVGLSEASIAGLTQDGFIIDERVPITLTNSELVRLTIPRGMTLDAARQAVADAAPSASVDFNHYYQPDEQDSAICTGRGCDLVRHIVGWPTQSGEPACNASLPIGLIDTAINEKHPSLSDAKIEVVRLGDQEVPQSGAQHGTAVAALLVGTTGSRAPGLIPAAQLVAVDAFQRYRKTADIANVYDLVRALDLLSSRGIRIINLSLSGPGNLLLEQAVRAATERGTILIAAAGNEGPNAKPVFPAAYPDVIAVTAVDKQMKAYRRAVRGGHIDIAAPGVGVWTAASISGARHKSGTSFAAPFVTAAASVLLAANTSMTASALEEELMRSASDIGEPGKDNVFGWGLLNARALCQG